MDTSNSDSLQPSQLTKLDWSVAYNRTSIHLSNQLRGKRFAADQLLLFDDSFQGLPADIQESARAAGIRLIGFDLTVPQQQAFEAALCLINVGGRKQKMRITPNDWLRAYQLPIYENAEGWHIHSQKHREEAFKALLALAIKPWLICYQKIENGREVRQTRIAPLWRLELTHDPRVAPLQKIEDLTPDYFNKADSFELVFEEIWFDQLDNFYIYKPKNLFERIRLSLPGTFEKIPASLHPFLEWVFAEAGRLRAQQKKEPQNAVSYTLTADWHEVALQSRLHRQLEKRNYKRAQEMIVRNAELAQKAGILNDFRFEGSYFVATFNPKQFEELESYIDERRKKPVINRKRAAKRNDDAPPWNPRKLGPAKVKELIHDWKQERTRIRELATSSRVLSEDENGQIARLSRWIREYETVLYGRNTATK